MITLSDWCGQNHREDILQCYLDADNPIAPDLIGFSSGKRVRWKCRTCGQTWEASPNSMEFKGENQTICPFCNHKRPSAFYNAAALYPEMLPYWDHYHNKGNLEDYLPKSGYVAAWTCRQGHTWTRPIKEQADAAERYRRNLSRRDGGLCPYCSCRRVSPNYNLEVVCKDVARQWCYSKNGALTPRDVSPYNQKKVFWQCPFDQTHIWADRISNRTVLLRGCPICSRQFRISYAASAIFYYLHQSGLVCSCEVPAGRYRVDIEIRFDRQGLPPVALEVDGYRHRLPEAAARDAKKSAFLKGKGYRVIRVKEADNQSKEIRVEDDVITYPATDRNLYLNRVIQHTLLVIAGIHIEPDHVRDHWKIEEFYYHTRKKHSLAVQYPDLAQEWSERNSDTPDVISPGLGAKRWWKCPKCGKEYQAAVSNRTRHGSACPYCAHLRADAETCLAAAFPMIASEWDYEKNAPLRPTDVFPGSDKRVWWRCGHGHSWQALIYMRTGRNGTKCPFCQGRAVEPETSLAGKTPALAQYWHPSKNEISPSEVAPRSNRIFWWKCPKGHEWKDMPNTLQKYPPERVCPYCDHRRTSEEYCLAAQNRSLAAFWHPSKNTCTEQEIAPYSSKKAWWRCEKGHEWKERVNQMQIFGAEKACPFCNNRKVWAGNSLACLAPHLAAEWHSSKNLPAVPENVLAWSGKKVWWRCACGHEWQAAVAKRYQRGDGCPYCSGHRASPENCLAALYPEIALEWDYGRNTPLTPYDVTANSKKRVWWKCPNGHNWQRTVSGHIRSKGCPICHHKQIRHQSFSKEHPELVGEWDTSKNAEAPDQFAAHSNQKVWWRCKDGHSWQATPDARSRGSGCPICAKERRKKPLRDLDPTDQSD